MTPELIFVIVGFWLVLLLYVLARVVGQRTPGESAPDSGRGAPEVSPRVRTPSLRPGALRGRPEGAPPSPPGSALTDVRPRRRPRVRIGSAREVRRGFILMEVLGACRGLEPPGPVRGGRRDA